MQIDEAGGDDGAPRVVTPCDDGVTQGGGYLVGLADRDDAPVAHRDGRAGDDPASVVDSDETADVVDQ
ncbi:hypothetical protein [Nocardioides sp. L-11A]|uniref:hypothetical protein n=1 Tax=Nocardioides sp. L-11A TaxID=3043848 RepID=UPI00249AB64D|nr:hypothetical protein QJ852_26425 [Nocardioides sp. L-11A]